ncbi:unnamed protein product [Ciceribacter selenitireducens ATCC BAA-1503]|uniref:Uncharacterized protein n=1 Tax=Ciceribacter selenitireducens ATCC BAA-1503 TaxID=1336235 RepID=A0A376AE26_9HYPH|nr:unnamed protein product [Ciceribacter selenitireducens ATCC BAA-1503]
MPGRGFSAIGVAEAIINRRDDAKKTSRGRVAAQGRADAPAQTFLCAGTVWPGSLKGEFPRPDAGAPS